MTSTVYGLLLFLSLFNWKGAKFRIRSGCNPAFCCQVSYRSVRYQVNRPHRGADRVRSLRDKVTSAYGLVTKPRGAVATASTRAVGGEDGVVRLTYVNC
jgi:hypothetical protein